MIKKQFTTLLATLLTISLSACVTQDFENGEIPIVKNQANRDDMAATRVSLGLGYLKMGNMPQAKQNLEKAKNFAPNMVQVYTAFAHYYEKVGEHELTVESYEKALSIKSDDADTLNNYGVYLCRQDQTQAAEQQFLKAIAVPSYILVAKSYDNLSACFLQEDDFSKAEMYLEKAILHNPSSASTLMQMVQLQYAMAEFKQAKLYQQRFEKVTRRFTSHSLALAYKVYIKLGQRKIAKNYATMLVKMYPQSWETQQYILNELAVIEADNLAKRFQDTQVHDDATQVKKRVVKLSPKRGLPIVAHAQTAAQTAAPTQVSTTKSSSNEASVAKENQTTTSSVVMPIANAAAINAALITAAVEASTPEQLRGNAKQAAIAAEVAEPSIAKTDKKLVVKTQSPATKSAKPLVVMTAPMVKITEAVVRDGAAKSNVEPFVEKEVTQFSKVEQGQVTKTAAESVSDAETKMDILTEKTIEKPIEDREIFYVAKKPAAIIEDNVEIPVGLKVVGKEIITPVQEKIKPVEKEIAAVAEKAKTVITEKASDKNISAQFQQEINETEAKQTTDMAKKSKKFPDFHVVEQGDTLYNISVKYNIKIKALRRWNKLSKNKRIHIKEILFLENPKSVNR